MSAHRSPGRPRYGRISALGSAVLVTGVAVLGGAGAFPDGEQAPVAAVSPVAAGTSSDTADEGGAGAVRTEPGRVIEPAAETSETPKTSETSEAGESAQSAAKSGSGQGEADGADGADGADEGGSGWLPAHPTFTVPVPHSALPPDSGEGRRVVFSEERQRVWLVEPRRAGGERVLRTYLVSGSIYDNLDPGTYEVYSRSEQAYGIDDSGTMRYFVRFTRGERAAIGFHDIPLDDGEPVQTRAQLGTPLSHGCIRQRPADAKALWNFAPIGTTVVVTP